MAPKPMDTRRIRNLRASIEYDALVLAMGRDIPDSRRKGSSILSERAPHLGWFDLAIAEDLEYAADVFQVRPTEEDIETALAARRDIAEADLLTLRGWVFDGVERHIIGQRKLGSHHHEHATELSCIDPDGNRHFRSDIPVKLGYQDVIPDGYETFKGKCDIWVWPDGRWEVDVASVKFPAYMDEHASGWKGESLSVYPDTIEHINLTASQNRAPF